MNFKQLLSYIIPVKIFQVQSDINKNLEVTWNNGQLVLDSKNTNFSFGSLARVMRTGLNQIGKENLKKYQSILLLGVGGGSVIHLLRKELDCKATITGVELDEKILALANRYFELDQFDNLEIVITDAQQFVKTAHAKYDMIVIDIFQDNTMPDFLFTTEFIKNIKTILTIEGTVLFNTITTLSADFERNKNYQNIVDTYFASVLKLSNVEGNNELFILSTR